MGQRPVPQNWHTTTIYKNSWINTHRASNGDNFNRSFIAMWSQDSSKRTILMHTETADSIYHYDSIVRYNKFYHTDLDPDAVYYYISNPSRIISFYPWIGPGIIVIQYSDKHRTNYN